MPTYEYLCDHCGQTMEIFQSITESPRKKCPQCGKQKLKRLLGTGAGVIFKGSGFYQTDYRSESYKRASEKDSPKPKSEKTSGTASSETKSAGKPVPASGD